MNINQRFHSSRRKSAHGGFKSRRLIVERIEDRLLLSGDFQTAVELQITSLDTSDYIIFSNNGSTQNVVGQVILDSAVVGAGIGRDYSTSNNGGTPTGGIHIHLDSFNGNTNSTSTNSGNVAIRFVDGDLSPVQRGKNYIDIGSLDKNSIHNSDNATIVQKQTVQPVAATNDGSSPILKSNITQLKVDGESGRSQMFDLAMASGREPKSDAMPLSKNMPDSPLVESRMSAPPSANAMPKEARSEIKLVAAQFVSNAANEADVTRSAAHDRPVLNHHNLLAKANFIGPSSQNSQAQQYQPVSTGGNTVSATLPAQLSDAADVNRQAVFSEIEQKADLSAPMPTYLEKHRANALGLAIVAIAGQFLVQKHQPQTAQSQTSQIPPRRRNLVK